MKSLETRLAQHLKAQIRQKGPITFRDFMAAALYDPDDGFYAKGSPIGSSEGVYLTNAQYPAFGFALARAVLRAEALVGEPLRIVEFGGGTGMLAAEIQRWLPVSRDYIIVEPSTGLRAIQEARGLCAVASPWELEPAPTVVLANEVLDALPVHRLMGMDNPHVCELYVTLDDREEFTDWPDRPSTVLLLDRLQEEGIVLGRGQIAEVCLDIKPFFEGVKHVMTRGYAIFIDYGDEASHLYSPTRRNGTLCAYWNQQRSNEWYLRVGDQDLTADVDYTAVRNIARQVGLLPAGQMSQGKWLQHLGIDEYAGSPISGRSDTYERRCEIFQLIHPARLGSAFDVLVFKTADLPDGSSLHL